MRGSNSKISSNSKQFFLRVLLILAFFISFSSAHKAMGLNEGSINTGNWGSFGDGSSPYNYNYYYNDMYSNAWDWNWMSQSGYSSIGGWPTKNNYNNNYNYMNGLGGINQTNYMYGYNWSNQINNAYASDWNWMPQNSLKTGGWSNQSANSWNLINYGNYWANQNLSMMGNLMQNTFQWNTSCTNCNAVSSCNLSFSFSNVSSLSG
ncbi:hypothetical protein JXL19_06160 [bacterium]|nr:hypothetical protein [bacterium]